MPTFFVTFNDDETKEYEAFSRSDLIEKHFGGDEARLKEEAKLLRFHHNTVQHTEDLKKGESDQEISSADTNPYGWREKGDKTDTDTKSS